jgi:hypothetical protein
MKESIMTEMYFTPESQNVKQPVMEKKQEYSVGVQDGRDSAYNATIDYTIDEQIWDVEAILKENMTDMIADESGDCSLEWRMGWVIGFAQELMGL